MSGGPRSRKRRGVAYWLSLAIGCLIVIVLAGLAYERIASVRGGPLIIPTPVYSTGPGGLYNPGVTLEPNPPVTQVP
ncbi:hypothetical protein [Gryllotalpicola protaetiae]|uniref:hypothetical protein n=1 Tax=Gryllotalpicola protaetiae TaxID=2419771 RepID=UPI0013C52303|nr:hypothetical protein [Gryllotalpicola protaetiae]